MKVYRDIYDDNGRYIRTNEVLDIMEATYSGKDMGERKVDAVVKWPTPIDFKICRQQNGTYVDGDYIELPMQTMLRDGVNPNGSVDFERFYLYTDNNIDKTARPMSAGDAFEYNITFYPRQYELMCCLMRDFIQEDATADNIIYSGMTNVRFNGGAYELTRRIKAVLDEAYHDENGVGLWNIELADAVNEKVNNALERFEFAFSNNSVMDALVKLNDKEGINTTFFINGRTIYVGYKRPYLCCVDKGGSIAATPLTMMYGKTSDKPITLDHGGIFRIGREVSKEMPVTKLFAYGASRNLNRYYCSDRIHPGRYVNRVMLPQFDIDGRTDFILSEEGVEKYGVRESSKIFEDIYPSLRYITYGDLRQIRYVVKIKASGLNTDTETGGVIDDGSYPIARVQCYKVVPMEDGSPMNILEECAPDVDLAVSVHCQGKVIRTIIYGGEDALGRQQLHDNKRVPYRLTEDGEMEYIQGAAFLVNDWRFEHDTWTEGEYVCESRDEWFTLFDMPVDATDTVAKDLKKKVKEAEGNRVQYVDIAWLSDVYVFSDYHQTSFAHMGYSAYCWARTNDNHHDGSDTKVDEIIAVQPISTQDTYLGLAEGRAQKTFDIYLRDVGFKIDEQTDFGDMVFLQNGTVKVSITDGMLMGREFTIDGSVTDHQSRVICAYNDDGTANPDFFASDSDLSKTDPVASKAFADGAFWRIRLNRSGLDAADNYANLNLIIPNQTVNAAKGDHCVLLDITMPDVYIHAAENKLLDEARLYLEANDKGNVSYNVDIDKVRFMQIPNYAMQMREGLNVRLADEDLQIRTENRRKVLFNTPGGLVTKVDTVKLEMDSEIKTYTRYNTMGITDQMGVKRFEVLIPKSDVGNDLQVIGHLPITMEVVEVLTIGQYFDPVSRNYATRRYGNVGDSIHLDHDAIEKITDYSEDLYCVVINISDGTGRYTNYNLAKNHELAPYYYNRINVSVDVLITNVEEVQPEVGKDVFVMSSQEINFRKNHTYEVVMGIIYGEVEKPVEEQFLLMSGYGSMASSFSLQYRAEELPHDNDDPYKIMKYTFTLDDSFNDGVKYRPTTVYRQNRHLTVMHNKLVSVVEYDYDEKGNVLDYMDFKIESVTVNISDNTKSGLQGTVNTMATREIEAKLKEVSTAATWGSVPSRIKETETEVEYNKQIYEGLANEARRHYRDLLSLRSNIFDPDGTCSDTFVQVMMLQVGADSMNYMLDKTRLGLDGTQHNFTLERREGMPDLFRVIEDDILRHYVYTQNGGRWSIHGNFHASMMQNEDGEWPVRYVYIKCLKDGTTGSWECDTEKHAVNDPEDEDCWFFNWGILSPDENGHYSLMETRGNAYIYGDSLVAGRISSMAKNSWFDLNNGDFMLSKGGHASLSYINGKLVVDGTAVEGLYEQTEFFNAGNMYDIQSKATVESGDYLGKYYDGVWQIRMDEMEDYRDELVEYHTPIQPTTSKLTFKANLLEDAPTGIEVNVGFMIAYSDGTSETVYVYKDVDQEEGDVAVERALTGGKAVLYIKITGYDTFDAEDLSMLAKITLSIECSISELEEKYKYLLDAMKRNTIIEGGVVLTDKVLLRDEDGLVNAGIDGSARYEGNGVTLFAGGDYNRAVEQAAGRVTDPMKKLPVLITKKGFGSTIGCMRLEDSGEMVIDGPITALDNGETGVKNKIFIGVDGVRIDDLGEMRAGIVKDNIGKYLNSGATQTYTMSAITIKNLTGMVGTVLTPISTKMNMSTPSWGLSFRSDTTAGIRESVLKNFVYRMSGMLYVMSGGELIHAKSFIGIKLNATEIRRSGAYRYVYLDGTVDFGELALPSINGGLITAYVGLSITMTNYNTDKTEELDLSNNEIRLTGVMPTLTSTDLQKVCVIGIDGALFKSGSSNFVLINTELVNGATGVQMVGLPTRPDGLPSGSLYRNGNQLCIV